MLVLYLTHVISGPVAIVLGLIAAVARGHRLRRGVPGVLRVQAVALLSIWQVFRPLSQGSQYYLIVFLAGTLPLVFLIYRSGLGRLDPVDRPGLLDWVLAALTFVVCLYPILPLRIGSGGGGYNAFLDRQGLLDPIDVAMGALLLVLILEACRRTTGWALPVVCGFFLAYGYYGGLLPQNWAIAHAGLNFDQIVDALDRRHAR